MGRQNQGLVTLIWVASVVFFALLVAGYIAGKA
jgi:phage shock protein PspC (stress-responsive transcriptional regulator)